jgi:hypothetical protein
MDMPAKADQTLRVIEREVDCGTAAASYRERADFYEGMTRMTKQRDGMRHWAIILESKAEQARRQIRSP